MEKKKYFGLIAEQVYEHLPEVAFLDDNKEPLSLHYESIFILMLKAVQELRNDKRNMQKQLNDANQKISDLQDHINNIYQKLNNL